MAILDINAFGGMEGHTKQVGQRDPRYAQYAKNARLWDGSLRQYRSPEKVSSCTGRFIVRHGVTCVNDCAQYGFDPCDGPASLIQLRNGRLTSNGIDIGVKRPTEKPEVAVESTSSAAKDHATIFRIVCLNDRGDSSGPSPATQFVKLAYGDQVTISWSGCAPYRVEALLTQSVEIKKEIGKDPSQWVVVGEFQSTKASFRFEPESWDLTSDGYDPNQYCDPPELCCFVISDDGNYIGWNGSTLYVSERHEPSRFLRSAIKDLHSNIVDVVTARSALYIATEDGINVALIQNDKDGPIVQIVKTYENHIPIPGTLSLHNSGAMYATPYGVAVVDQAGHQPQIVTSQLIPEDVFERDWLPSRGVTQRGIFYGTDADKSWHIDFPGTSGDAAQYGRVVVLDRLGDYQYPAKDGRLYFSDATGTYKFDHGRSYLPVKWKSNLFVMKGISSFAVYKAFGINLESVIMTIYVDGAEVFREKIQGNNPCALPLCVNGLNFEVCIEMPGSSEPIELYRLQFASSMAELGKIQ